MVRCWHAQLRSSWNYNYAYGRWRLCSDWFAGTGKEGWQLSPPRDPMGSGDMGIVEAEETESGGITVRLYKRKYMLSDDGEIVLTKGPLIDVPLTSWIDIRLQMPEKGTPPEERPESAE